MTDETRLEQTSEIKHLFDLLKQEEYTPEEAARVLNVKVDLLLKNAFGGDLKATIVKGDVISIARADLVDWLIWRENH